jgi:hypothetical protein
MGSWLVRKWNSCQAKKVDARIKLDELGLPEDLLRVEWQKQLKEQTKPTVRFSKKSGQRAVEEILGLQETEKTYKTQIANLEERQKDYNSIEEDYMELAVQLKEIYMKLENVHEIIRQKKAVLSVDGRINLKKIVESKYLQLRIKAQGLKTRIRDHLRNRKFELDRLEQSHRLSSGEGKLQNHIKSSFHSRGPQIQRLTKTYNETCSQIHRLIDQGDAPLGAQVPNKIEKESLFKLDVDDEIWQDINVDNLDGSVPAWLGDNNIRDGIRVLLQHDRCVEEEMRIVREVHTLREWMQEEWVSIQNCIHISGMFFLLINLRHSSGYSTGSNPPLQYQFKIYANELKKLCIEWKKQIQTLSLPNEQCISQHWGPSDEELVEFINLEGSYDVEVAEDELPAQPEDAEYSEFADEEDAELLEQVEMLAVTEAYVQENEGINVI